MALNAANPAHREIIRQAASQCFLGENLYRKPRAAAYLDEEQDFQISADSFAAAYRAFFT